MNGINQVAVEDFFGPEEAKKVIMEGINCYDKSIRSKHKYVRVS